MKSVTVAVTGGLVQGIQEQGNLVFKGIPYAAPPVGERRWKSPQPVIPWDGVLHVNHFQASCPQCTATHFGGIKDAIDEMSEDCLYLNIWVPGHIRNEEENLPVIVWIHGGGFAQGSTTCLNYAGDKFAEKGVVFVSIAYRLGAFGFLAHPELSAENEQHVSGNYGLLDQIAALRWVRRNIGHFGGNPDNVTVFGESSGGFSVHILCASPLATGLFNHAISESGGFFPTIGSDNRMVGIETMTSAEEKGKQFALRLGAASIHELRDVPANAFLEDETSQIGGFWPVYDGYVIPGDPYQRYAKGIYNDIDILIGFNSDEGSLFIRNKISHDQHIQYLKVFEPFLEKAIEIYPGDTKKQMLVSQQAVYQDMKFAWPTYAWARLQSITGHSKVYFYYFKQPRHCFKPAGAAHTDEINYVFGHIDKNFNDRYTNKDRELSNTMMAYWVNFARTGNPNEAGLPLWPPYRENSDTVMYISSDELRPGPVPNLSRMQFVEKVRRKND